MTADQAIVVAVDQYKSGRFVEADGLCRQILASNPNHLHALHLQSLLAAQANRLDEALRLISRAISINPSVADYFVNRAEYQRRMGRLDDAVDSLQQALRLSPNNASAHYNLGVVQAERGKSDDALVAYQRAVALNPNLLEAQIRLGNEYRRRHRMAESAAAFQQAIRIRPDSREAHWNYSIVLLQAGNFANGWREYEWRRGIGSICRPRNFSQPEWTGQDLNGQTIFLHVEQAFGDIIQFARFAPKVAERGGRVILESHPELVRVLGGVDGVEQVVSVGAPLPRFNLHCPLVSLAQIFSPDGDGLSSEIPYLHADAQLIDEWKRRLEPYRGKVKVGLNWVGRKMLMDGRDRSIPSAALATLRECKYAVFFSVQPRTPDAQPPPGELDFIDCSTDLRDFADTAALMANLDLIISVDTAAAHLAGALGRPVWTMLLHDADWRWLLDREDSPWYPTMRLFREPADGGWASVIHAVAQNLNRFEVRSD